MKMTMKKIFKSPETFLCLLVETFDLQVIAREVMSVILFKQ